MIKFEDIEVAGICQAVKGCRNPLSSWHLSDSYYEDDAFVLGDKDLDLLKRLYKGGTEHRKFMRQIYVCMTITAPLLWWKQFDQYKVGVTTDSCSTMHTIHKTELTIEDFSCDGMDEWSKNVLKSIIDAINLNRYAFNTSKDSQYWQSIIRLLPESYNQKRTVTMNYEVAANIIRQRRGHKLPEWEGMIKMLLTLPFLKEIMGEEE